MTLKELRESVPAPKKGARVPSRKRLLESGTPFISENTFDSTVTVYSDGFVLYETGDRHTVFPLPNKNKGYRYSCSNDLNGGNADIDIDADYFADCDFAVLLTLIGEDRIAENSNGGYNRRIESDIETYEMFCDNSEGRRDCEDEVIAEAIPDEMLKNLTKKQRTAVVMHALHGLTFDEIGRHIGSSRQYAQKLYKQGVSRLQVFV